MKILIDGQDDLISLKPGHPSSGLLESIDATLHAGDKIIERCIWNGKEIEIEFLEKQLAQKTQSPGESSSGENAQIRELQSQVKTLQKENTRLRNMVVKGKYLF